VDVIKSNVQSPSEASN